MLCTPCSVVTLGDLRGSMSDVDISVSSRPASRSSSLDTCGLDQQQTAQAKPAAQAANMVKLWAFLLQACLSDHMQCVLLTQRACM